MGELQEYDRMSIIEMREKIVGQLKLNFAHDNLDDTELENLLEQAHSATSKLQLIAVVQNLPHLEENPTERLPESSIKLNHGRIQEQDNMVAILSGNERKGVWRPARRTNLTAVLGGIDLDYTEAEFPPGTTDITIFAFFGGVELKVPEDLNVEVQAVPILGGIENHAKGGDEGGPLLRIKAIAVFGGVEIKTDKKKKRRK